MPLHLWIASDGAALGAGRTLRKLLRTEDLTGRDIFDLFEVLKPRGVYSIQELARSSGRRLRLRARTADRIEFRALAVELEGDGFLLNLSMGTKMAELVTEFSLKDRDFSPADGSIELLFLLETQHALLHDQRALAERLRCAKEQAEALALTDMLTGVPNRRAFSMALDRCLGSMPMSKEAIALLHLDLDNFKQINDRLGHAAGDRVLRQAAEIFSSEIKSSDTLGRVGGDEFMLLLTGDPDAASVEATATRIISRVSTEILEGRPACRIGLSIGAVRHQWEYGVGATADADRLIREADIALYAAKRGGRGRLELFSPSLRSQIDRERRLAEELAQGVEERAFEPFFQPQIDVETSEIHGFEALLRWRHPEFGLLSPPHFLSIAEGSGLLADIEDLLLSKVIDALTAWRRAGLAVPAVSVNMTASRLLLSGFVDRLSWLCDAADLDASAITIEVLESVLLEGETDGLVAKINRLAEQGHRIDLDDFGTGHAAISNLRRFPVDTVKIDRSFIVGIDRSTELQKMTQAMITLIRSLDITALAEGVETAEEIQTLQRLGCTLMQGFAIGRPMVVQDVPAWIASHIASRSDMNKAAAS
ncbi:MAG: EAL domain-containing protein [Pseudomonadota bacterium]